MSGMQRLRLGVPSPSRPLLRLEDYQSNVPRWCAGCGDGGVLAALQRLCRDEQLPPERCVFVSGIGCSSRLPHSMRCYGFHSLHGRALPVAEGVKIRRPDLHVFVNTGDGDCCSIGTAHWIHAVRYNMNLTVILHDNEIYGLTKMQASPTSPRGLHSNTSPRGTVLEPLNPLAVTLAIANVSFVAQVVDWAPDLLDPVLRAAWRHRGFSFVRVLQRCPNYLPHLFAAQMRDPSRLQVLEHADGIQLDTEAASAWPNRVIHDPSDLPAARRVADGEDPLPVGVLYRNDAVPCYEDLRASSVPVGPEAVVAAVEAELDRYAVPDV
jgi:2-oxoglutarate ferredoxin oxidoreductase subunit beta